MWLNNRKPTHHQANGEYHAEDFESVPQTAFNGKNRSYKVSVNLNTLIHALNSQADRAIA